MIVNKSSSIDMGGNPVLSYHPVDTGYSLDGHTDRAQSTSAANQPEAGRKEKESAKAAAGGKPKESTKGAKKVPTLADNSHLIQTGIFGTWEGKSNCQL
ncbi:hypothetical protein AVEN_107306-1 [Araneus ventricosus]|uniref:Uncharacterized protein n=1 Tax=Araneus ventricosus TaxID=182803 RepID=A0A4Y2DUE5_ARAVE|nr:hypothetical protein AVEN_107306-1 [Araneus ventricosus]